MPNITAGVNNHGLEQHKSSIAGVSRGILCVHVRSRLSCGRQDMIDSATVAQIVATMMGCWALGFGIGKSVAWTRKIVDVV